MWTTVTETLLFLCSLVVICPFIRAPLPNRDEKSSASTIETVFDRVNTALHGIQRSMRTQPGYEDVVGLKTDSSLWKDRLLVVPFEVY